jgi:hypothetical protein
MATPSTARGSLATPGQRGGFEGHPRPTRGFRRPPPANEGALTPKSDESNLKILNQHWAKVSF